jgi:hypothetical protein
MTRMIDEKVVSATFRRHYLATGSKSDAWNKTLHELTGPVGNPQARKVADILSRVSEPIASKLRGKVKSEMVVLDVHPLDVWGNARDGYEVNDVYHSRGSIEIPIDASHNEIVTAMKREGFIDRNIHMKSVEIDGEPEYGLNIADKKGKPVYQLRSRHKSGGGARLRRR